MSARPISRRTAVKLTGAGGAGLLLGGRSAVAAAAGRAVPEGPATEDRETARSAGPHQAGITTAPQRHLALAAFDLSAGSVGDVVELLRTWQAAIALLTSGQPLSDDTPLALPPIDTGEAAGQGPASLTVTIGFGPSMFDDRFGLRAKRPPALVNLPDFAHDQLDPARSGGDLSVQACANTRTVAEHAIRDLARVGRNAAQIRWLQWGFSEPPAGGGTPRNLLGFKDGTSNLDAADDGRMRRNVWAAASDGAAWMAGGTYQVYRRVRIQVRAWDATALSEQHLVIGRVKRSGAPFGGVREFDTVAPSELPPTSHVRLANPRTGQGSEDERILRRGYNYHDGYDLDGGDFDAGVVFIAYQRDPRRQFIPIQRRLDALDALNEYATHTASAVFAIPPVTTSAGVLGSGLFAD